MINFKQIFNTNYISYGLILILLLILLIFMINKNTNKSLNNIGISLLVSGLIILLPTILIKLIFSTIIPSEYKLFINVITNSLFKNLILYSLIIVILGIISITISTIIKNKSNKVKI